MMDILINTYDTMAKILLVEDEINIASFIERGLREFGHEVYVAYDGAAGWELTQKNDFQLLILDIIMPKMNGLQLCKQYRQRFGYHAPVIMLTALGTTEDIVSGLDAGADDYLVKPFVLAELLARVRALARRSYGYQNEAVEIRGLSLHVPTRRVTVSSRHIELTASEYALLETLMLRADRVLTRRFLEERIFGAKENMSNALDVHMGNLRRKIGDGYVRTVRGVGYVIDTVAIQKEAH